MAEKKMNFEESISRLEEIVKLLEKGDAPLESSLSLFEEGTALAKKCSAMLDSAEQKVTILMKGEDDSPAEAEFPKE